VVIPSDVAVEVLVVVEVLLLPVVVPSDVAVEIPVVVEVPLLPVVVPSDVAVVVVVTVELLSTLDFSKAFILYVLGRSSMS
jgi:hypothetical protein